MEGGSGILIDGLSGDARSGGSWRFIIGLAGSEKDPARVG